MEKNVAAAYLRGRDLVCSKFMPAYLHHDTFMFLRGIEPITPQITQIHSKVKKQEKSQEKIGLLYNFERCRKEGREGRKKLIKRGRIQNYFRVTVLSRDLST